MATIRLKYYAVTGRIPRTQTCTDGSKLPPIMLSQLTSFTILLGHSGRLRFNIKTQASANRYGAEAAAHKDSTE